MSLKDVLDCSPTIRPCAVQSEDNVGIQEVTAWQQIAAAWSEGLLKKFPLYRDLLQPVALAVFEVRHGLSLLLAHAKNKAQSVSRNNQLAAAVVSDAMTFPSRLQQGESCYVQTDMCT